MKRLVYIVFALVVVACNSEPPSEEGVGVENQFNDTLLGVDDTSVIKKTELLADSIDGRPNNNVLQKENGLRVEWERKNETRKITQDDVVLINYSARVAGGETYDGNEKIGAPVPVCIGIGMLVPGMEEGLMEMAEGDKGRFLIPNALGYGPDGYGAIVPPMANLIIDVEIVDLVDPIELEDGVKVYKWQEVDTSRTPKKDDWIYFDYFAYTRGEEGKMYDNSYQNGSAYKMKFQNDNVVDGLHIGMSVMKAGENAFIQIPAKAAYGSKGLVDMVPKNTDILYDVRVLSID